VIDLIRRMPRSAELVIVNLICFGPFIVMSAMGLVRRETTLLYDDRRLYTIVVIELLCAPLAIAFLRARGWRFSDLGLRLTMPQTIAGMLLFIWANVAIASLYSLFTALSGSDPASLTTPVIRTSWIPLILMLLIDPLFEEGFIVAWNIRAAEQYGAAFAITLSATLRLLCHAYQGPIAPLTILPLGLIFAAIYWKWRRLWPLMVAHGVAGFFALAPGTEL
jgi:hypothetical protein